MNGRLHTGERIFFLLFLVMALPTVVSAQLISLKTVPVATGDQFLIFPSQNLGMGGVSLALEDSLLDPFINPAKGARLKGAYLFSSPTYFSVSGNIGTARTLPTGVLVGSRTWFGGFSLAVQQLDVANQNNSGVSIRSFDLFAPSPQRRLSEKSSNNMYVSGLLGKKLAGSPFALAGSVFLAGLDAVDGVDLLYPRSQTLDQFGSIADYRAGLLGEWQDGRSFEALLLHNRFNMTHNVTYQDWVWDPVIQQSSLVTRLERNLDRTNTWGFHTGYVHSLVRSGVRLGGILTVNRKSHPKIPNYELMNIPRDPGDSWAYNVGLGIARTESLVTVGMDVLYEPIWSHTWADAATPVVTPSGRILPPGSKTVANDFRFSNVLLRMGIRREERRFGLQFGLQVRAIRYRLEQENYAAEFRRKQKEHWAEWTASWGATVKFSEFQLRYFGRMTTGTGRPGVAGPIFRSAASGLLNSDFIIAPGGSLTLQDARVMTHQLTVSVPLRNHR